MIRTKIAVAAAAALAVLALPALGWAEENALERTEREAVLRATNQVLIYGSMHGPGWVQSYSVTCSGKARLRVEIRDCCIPGDHFEASARSWDSKPTTIRMLATGNTSSWVRGDLRGFGANPLRALVNVRYLHGINDFSAGFDLRLTCLPSSSTITYTDEGQVCDTSK